jgi:MFS family permease
MVITYLDRVCISVAGPRMQEALHIGPVAWGWVTGVFTISYAAFEIPSGALGDRIGPRRVLTRVVLWWSAFTSLTGAMTGYYPLLLTRFCFGMGEAGAFPIATRSLSRWMLPAERGFAQGVTHAGSRLAAAATPLLVVAIIAARGWRAPFFLFGTLGIAWAALLVLPARPPASVGERRRTRTSSTRSRRRAGPVALVLWQAILSSGNL